MPPTWNYTCLTDWHGSIDSASDPVTYIRTILVHLLTFFNGVVPIPFDKKQNIYIL